MTISYPIYRRFSGNVLFTAQIDCPEDKPDAIKKHYAVLWAIENKQPLNHANLSYANLSHADLSGADLRSADLSDADLSDANLRDANLRHAKGIIASTERADGYRFVGWISDGVMQINAGCRSFSISEAREHWDKTRPIGTALGDETRLILDHIEAVAKLRGLIQ